MVYIYWDMSNNKKKFWLQDNNQWSFDSECLFFWCLLHADPKNTKLFTECPAVSIFAEAEVTQLTECYFIRKMMFTESLLTHIHTHTHTLSLSLAHWHFLTTPESDALPKVFPINIITERLTLKIITERLTLKHKKCGSVTNSPLYLCAHF